MFAKAQPINNSGKLYVMRFWLDDEEIVYKVGVTTRKPEDRLMDILLSYYKGNRYVPRCDIKRFRTVDDVFGKEAILLASLQEFRYNSEKKFSGCTEMFQGIDEPSLLELYDRVVAGEHVGTVVCCGSVNVCQGD